MHSRPPLALREASLGRQLCSCRETVNLALHPCQEAAAFLLHTRPSDCMLSGRPRRHLGNVIHQSQCPYISDHRAFIVTCSGSDTMARHRQDTEDEITVADDTACNASFSGSSLRDTRQVTPISMPDDLCTALAMPTTFGPKLFEISTLHAVSAACKVKVKDTGDLLLLRDWLFEELGPPYMWTVMLSVVEWEHLTNHQKELHSTMRESWLSIYSKASHTIAPTLDLEVPQETDRVFRTPSQSVFKNQG
jgi:hypothetical protein